MDKFSVELQLIISRKVGDDNWNLEVILKQLVQEIAARERSATTMASHPQVPAKTAGNGLAHHSYIALQ